MVHQAHISQRHLGALRKVVERLHRSEVNWVVCAGMSLALQGVPVAVHDIDVETNAAGSLFGGRLRHKAIPAGGKVPS